MSYFRFSEEDRDNAIRNMVTGFGGGGGAAYNAVLETVFSSESGTESVTLQEAKDWCRIDISDDDVLITELITAAREICEDYVNLSLIQRTVTATINNGLGNFNLPYGPLLTLTSITDVDGTVQDITTFFLRDAYDGNQVVVYDAGYVTLPKKLKTAILCQIAWMYENRGDVALVSQLSNLAMLILKPLRSV